DREAGVIVSLEAIDKVFAQAAVAYGIVVVIVGVDLVAREIILHIILVACHHIFRDNRCSGHIIVSCLVGQAQGVTQADGMGSPDPLLQVTPINEVVIFTRLDGVAGDSLV